MFVRYHHRVNKPLILPALIVISELPPESFFEQQSLVAEDSTNVLGTRLTPGKPAFPVKRIDAEATTVACPFIGLGT